MFNILCQVSSKQLCKILFHIILKTDTVNNPEMLTSTDLCFWHCTICWSVSASHDGEKSRTQLLTQSVTHPTYDSLGTKAFALE